MTQDVYSQLARRIVEGQYIGDLRLIRAEMSRQFTAYVLDRDEFNRLRIAINEREDRLAEEAAS